MMIAGHDRPFRTAADLSARPARFLLEQSHQALARIEWELCQKLNAIAALSSPTGMDEIQWESAKAAMEVQAKKDTEEEKLPYKAFVQFSEKYQIYGSFRIDEKTLREKPTENGLMGSQLQEAEKKIEELLLQYSYKNDFQKLDLSGLHIHSVPDSIQKLFSTIVKLDLSNNYLKSLPDSVTNLVNLTNLDLHSNQLTSLPDSMGRLVKLKALNVSGNSFAALPDSIESCHALEQLMANFNKLTQLPEGLGFQLLNLRELCVHSNKLTHLPYSTSHMMSLRFLDVHMNRLGGLPNYLDNLLNLEYLDLSSNFNYLVALPESIGGLTSLVELNISYNQIIILPESIGRLEKLRLLKVEGNPLAIPAPQVVDEGVEAIKEYLANRLNARCGVMKSARQPCLRRMALWKWATPSCDMARSFSSISTLRRRAFCSPLRRFTPRRSLSALVALATPRRTFRYELISNSSL